MLYLLLIYVVLAKVDMALYNKFMAWKQMHGKVYQTEDEQLKRFQVFSQNTLRIQHHNSQVDKTFTMGMNKFGDLTVKEFKTLVSRPYNRSSTLHTYRVREIPELQDELYLAGTVDWVRQGKVSRVKDQGLCGGCWAFAVNDAVESAVAIKHNKAVVETSIQELLDCDHKGVAQGCIGGQLPEGFLYVIEKKGLCPVRGYKFQEERGRCKSHSRYCQQHRYGAISDYGIVPANNERKLALAVARQPVAAAIEADADALQFYEGGVLRSRRCGAYVDHAVLIVGFGSRKGRQYWKVKNSWGRDWGENGYVRLCRNCGINGSRGMCGIAVEGVYPIV